MDACFRNPPQLARLDKNVSPANLTVHMYTKHIQIINYGPIAHLDIEFPFEGDNPRPVVLVGKTVLEEYLLISYCKWTTIRQGQNLP